MVGDGCQEGSRPLHLFPVHGTKPSSVTAVTTVRGSLFACVSSIQGLAKQGPVAGAGAGAGGLVGIAMQFRHLSIGICHGNKMKRCEKPE